MHYTDYTVNTDRFRAPRPAARRRHLQKGLDTSGKSGCEIEWPLEFKPEDVALSAKVKPAEDLMRQTIV